MRAGESVYILDDITVKKNPKPCRTFAVLPTFQELKAWLSSLSFQITTPFVLLKHFLPLLPLYAIQSQLSLQS
uniref:Transposase n=1 Tax=Caenorhabditis tropicalis TaxID=1561998 RepID=A0A1I7V294_9PELO